jgi:predicted enzyme related to lactoylglutathione lyase
MSNAINWFEIPAADFNRAVKFYSEVLGAELQTMKMGETDMAFFPSKDKGVGGCVTHGNGQQPNAQGSTVYLNGGEDLSVPLSKVEKAGGSVVLPKTSIGENGFFAVFMDTEGNKVAFHSMS